ncbi:FtsK-like DNA translocase [Streptomyces phage Mischief19]|nr:FtsK-like DNA translocase [Streptomyces phage Mischief19]
MSYDPYDIPDGLSPDGEPAWLSKPPHVPLQHPSQPTNRPATPLPPVDLDELTALFERSQMFSARLGTPADTRPHWTRGQVAKVGYWSASLPTVVSVAANLSAWQWPGWEVPFTGGAVAAVATVATIAGLNHHWSPTAAGVSAALAIGGLQFATSAGSGGWMEVVSWLTGAAATVAYAIVWNRKHAKDRAEVQLIEAKRRTELLKGNAVLSASALKDMHLMQRIEREQREAALAALQGQAPVFQGATPEERLMRRAVWDAFAVQLMTCDVRFTRTGYVATVGLPVELSRNAAKTGWDKVSSALRADGRFIVADGRLSNELDVKFLDRSKVDTSPLLWTPARMHGEPKHYATLGINTETGDEVAVQFDERLLICGASGTGKSWSTRPLLAHAHLNGDLVMLDGKGEEANIWGDVCRVAIEAEEIEALIDAIHDEMSTRKAEMAARKISVWDGQQLTVFIDEGQVILALVSGDRGRMQRLRELASLGRSRGIVLWWATQKPTMSGTAPGIDSQMAGNLLQRFSLRVATENEARTALDDCAHYGPQSIPDDRSMRGHGYLKGYGPSLLRTFTIDDDGVRTLPKRVWSGAAEHEAGLPLADRAARYLLENPGASERKMAEALDVPRATLQRALKGS